MDKKNILFLIILTTNFLFAKDDKIKISDFNTTYNKIPEEEIISFANAPLPPKSDKIKYTSKKSSNKKYVKKDIKIIKGNGKTLIN